MDPLGTVLIVSRRGADWCTTRDILFDEYGDNDDGLALITGLRVSHPDVIRVLALEADANMTQKSQLQNCTGARNYQV